MTIRDIGYKKNARELSKLETQNSFFVVLKKGASFLDLNFFHLRRKSRPGRVCVEVKRREGEGSSKGV
jgi:hypothetical protein